jgi:hypothetical protein
VNSFMLLSVLALNGSGDVVITVPRPHHVEICASVTGCDPTPCGAGSVGTNGFIVAPPPCREPSIPQRPRSDPGSNIPEPHDLVPPLDVRY